MSSGLTATVIVFLLVGLFGLVIFYDRKRTTEEETAARSVTETYMNPEERWEAHVKELRRRQK